MVLLKCKTCGKHVVRASTGAEYINTDNLSFWMALIHKAQEAETERILERARVSMDPDYAKLAKLEQQIKDLVKIVGEKDLHLQQLRHQLAASQKNDPIWEALPKKVKAELVKKYGPKAGVTAKDVL